MVDTRTADGREIAADGGRIGLALSGGGLKAALFHIGVLARLAELDLLRQVEVISGISGGALIAAAYHLHLKRALDAEGDIGSDRLVRLVADLESHLLGATQTDFANRLSTHPLTNLRRAVSHTRAERLGKLLERYVFRPIREGDPGKPVAIRDLAIRPRGDQAFNPTTDNPGRYCKVPALIVNAANLTTGHGWRFDAERMGEPPMAPSVRRLAKAPICAAGAYDRLPDRYAGMTLGEVIAAAMAMPGIVEPYRLKALYPDPNRPSALLDVDLAAGNRLDPLGTDALIASGCQRLIVSDASGFEDLDDGATQRQRARQLEALEARPGMDLVLIHMLAEIEPPQIMPAVPQGRGQIIEDRSDKDVTGYGVERRLQRRLASLPPSLDAPSEIAGLGLMADGYLIAKRAFHLHRQRAAAWTDSPAINVDFWRFAAVIDVLRMPSRDQLRHLSGDERQASAPRRSGPIGFGVRAFSAVITALPLAILALMRRLARLSTLKAGRLTALGIKPVTIDRSERASANEIAPADDTPSKAA